ncbi:MAG: HAMP domain-containing histidine kinase [Cyclobacteriaceae bacterium]|nr:HAMP domain-containing histidine kinase [Cyclobacteriaceae bacterium]
MEKNITKEELYLEIQNLSREVKFLYKKLDKNEKYRTHFLSNMRNSIVNPFSSIMGLSEHIIKVQKHDWKKVIRISSLIHSEAYNLDFQLKNIFCAAEVEAGIKAPVPMGINIVDHINKDINSLRFLFRRKGLNWIIDHEGLEELFHIDPAFFSLILNNLFHNAYKYSKKDGEISIKTVKTENNLEILIKDFGTGISKDHQKDIFNSFERINLEINSIDSGQGLGLSVVKLLVELLNGQISVESEINTFTEFRLVIPEMEPSEEGNSDDSENPDFFIEEGAIF